MAGARKKLKKKAHLGWKGQILLIFMLLAALAALPTTVMLFFGMLPTAAAAFIDRTAEKTRVLTVGAMNLAGCSPFILQLWTSEHSIENSVMIVTDPRTIIVMYCAAGIGYMIDWTVSGLVGAFMVSRASSRLEQIAKHQKEMVVRWGREVTGEIPVDSFGFPLDSDAEEKKSG